MINTEQKALMEKYWDQKVVYAFKKGLWELERITNGKCELRRFKGYKSPEVVDSITFLADNVENIIEVMSKVKFSAKEKKILVSE